MIRIKINTGSTIPIYKQIIEQIKSKIFSEELKKNDLVPSVRALAMQLKVNPLTVQRAFQELKSEDLIYYKRGEGTFVQGEVKGSHLQKKVDEIDADINRVITKSQIFNINKDTLKKLWESNLKSIKEKK